MNAFRSEKDKHKYKQYLARIVTNVCQFCAIGPDHKQYVRETAHFKVIVNLFPYATWDNQSVVEHLMIIPKQHRESLRDMTSEESIEYVEQVSHFERHNYNIYARAKDSQMRSVRHQHTHLIKIHQPAGTV